MKVAGRRASRGLTVLRTAIVGILVAAGSLLVGVPSASAMTCPYDTANHTSNVTLSSTDYAVTLRANGPYLEIADVFCALLSDVNTVNINASASPTINLTFDLTNGPLGPGYTDEGNGSSEIEFIVTGLSSTSQLSIKGTDGPDKITAGWLFNKFSGYSAGQINLNALADGSTVDNDISFPNLPGSTQILTYGGDDIVSAAGTGTLYTGPAVWPLFIDGGVGSNQITGGSANDRLWFVEAIQPDGPDAISGGGGFDTAHAYTPQYADATHGSISLDGVANDGTDCPGTQCNGDNVGLDIERVEGSNANENIVGNSAGQEFDGGGGNDLVQGLGGKDTFTCNSGTYEGGGGADTFVMQGSKYEADCGIVRGGKGKDTMSFASSYEKVNVTLDNLSNDGRVGATSNVRTDVERVIGSQYNDSLTGSAGKETLDGGPGNDALAGLGGNDTLMPGPGVDAVAGGSGVDRLSYATSLVPVIINAVTGAVTAEGNDSFSSIESYVGSPFADEMDGNGTNERMSGGAGDDHLSGAGGDDVLLGGDGDDSLDGGQGVDICDQGLGAGTVLNCEG
jgi:hypothetical protein